MFSHFFVRIPFCSGGSKKNPWTMAFWCRCRLKAINMLRSSEHKIVKACGRSPQDVVAWSSGSSGRFAQGWIRSWGVESGTRFSHHFLPIANVLVFVELDTSTFIDALAPSCSWTRGRSIANTKRWITCVCCLNRGFSDEISHLVGSNHLVGSSGMVKLCSIPVISGPRPISLIIMIQIPISGFKHKKTANALAAGRSLWHGHRGSRPSICESCRKSCWCSATTRRHWWLVVACWSWQGELLGLAKCTGKKHGVKEMVWNMVQRKSGMKNGKMEDTAN